jgi:hypothetical protein
MTYQAVDQKTLNEMVFFCIYNIVLYLAGINSNYAKSSKERKNNIDISNQLRLNGKTSINLFGCQISIVFTNAHVKIDIVHKHDGLKKYYEETQEFLQKDHLTSGNIKSGSSCDISNRENAINLAVKITKSAKMTLLNPYHLVIESDFGFNVN